MHIALLYHFPNLVLDMIAVLVVDLIKEVQSIVADDCLNEFREIFKRFTSYIDDTLTF